MKLLTTLLSTTLSAYDAAPISHLYIGTPQIRSPATTSTNNFVDGEPSHQATSDINDSLNPEDNENFLSFSQKVRIVVRTVSLEETNTNNNDSNINLNKEKVVEAITVLDVCADSKSKRGWEQQGVDANSPRTMRLWSHKIEDHENCYILLKKFRIELDEEKPSTSVLFIDSDPEKSYKDIEIEEEMRSKERRQQNPKKKEMVKVRRIELTIPGNGDVESSPDTTWFIEKIPVPAEREESIFYKEIDKQNPGSSSSTSSSSDNGSVRDLKFTLMHLFTQPKEVTVSSENPPATSPRLISFLHPTVRTMSRNDKLVKNMKQSNEHQEFFQNYDDANNGLYLMTPMKSGTDDVELIGKNKLLVYLVGSEPFKTKDESDNDNNLYVTGRLDPSLRRGEWASKSSIKLSYIKTVGEYKQISNDNSNNSNSNNNYSVNKGLSYDFIKDFSSGAISIPILDPENPEMMNQSEGTNDPRIYNIYATIHGQKSKRLLEPIVTLEEIEDYYNSQNCKEEEKKEIKTFRQKADAALTYKLASQFNLDYNTLVSFGGLTQGKPIGSSDSSASSSDRKAGQSYISASQHMSLNIFMGLILGLAVIVGIRQRPECGKDDDEEDSSNKTNGDSEDTSEAAAESLLPASESSLDKKKPTSSNHFYKFQLTYLCAWYFCILGDWFQGPLFYEIPVEIYQWSNESFNLIAVAGFLSAIIFGGFSGYLADKFGAKTACIAYCILNMCCAVSYFFNNFWILSFGQVLNGLATRILFTAFESWYVSQHFTRGYSGNKLGTTLSWMFFGSSLAAILSGFIVKAVDEITKKLDDQPRMIYDGTAGNSDSSGTFSTYSSADFGSYPHCAPKLTAQTGNSSDPEHLKRSSWFGIYIGGKLWVWLLDICVLSFGMFIIVWFWSTKTEESIKKEKLEEEKRQAEEKGIELTHDEDSSDGLIKAEKESVAFSIEDSSNSGKNNSSSEVDNEDTKSNKSESTQSDTGLFAAFRQMKENPLIILVGLSVAFFEGSMYIFVCTWSSTFFTINAYYNGYHADHGVSCAMVFTVLMTSFFMGSCAFNKLRTVMTLQSLAWKTFLAASLALLLPAISLTYLEWGYSWFNQPRTTPASMKLFLDHPEDAEADGDNRNLVLFLQLMAYVGFCIFEFCVGLYFPTMGSIKANITQESTRTTTYSLFYIPMNIMICIALSWHLFCFPYPYSVGADGTVDSVESKWIFTTQEKLYICTMLLGIGFVCMCVFNCKYVEEKEEEEEKKDSEDNDVTGSAGKNVMIEEEKPLI